LVLVTIGPLSEFDTFWNDWLTSRVTEDAGEIPETLWHYTTAAGLHGILTSQQVWATDTRFLNDATEIQYGIDLFVHALSQVSVGRNGPTYRFLNGLTRDGAGVIRSFLDGTMAAFVTCFCSQGDLLSQWRGYAASPDRSGGYALGFHSRQPQSWVQVAPGDHDLRLRRVRYNRADQEATCQSFVYNLVEIFDHDSTDLQSQNAFARILIDGLIEIATASKHPSFEEENEWRVIYLRPTDQNPLVLNFRFADGLLIPYVQLHVPEPTGANAGRLPVKQIMCGPTRDPERARIGLLAFLASLDLDWINVLPTIAPLRI
jgi:hypothetical protein